MLTESGPYVLSLSLTDEEALDAFAALSLLEGIFRLRERPRHRLGYVNEQPLTNSS